MDRRSTRDEDTAAAVEDVARHARDLRGGDDLDPLLDRVGDARVVMLGEASHGTSEYYAWRARLSLRLIREKGFSFVGVEGDWPDASRVNRYVKDRPGADASAVAALRAFERWPAWMWANWEIAAFAEGLRRHNDRVPDDRRVGFYGLDVYALWESLDAIMGYLRSHEPDALGAAERAYACFEPYGEDVQAYARASAFVPTSCEDEVVALLSELRGALPDGGGDAEARFDAEQNARSAVGAERYYRAMVRGGGESWNVRDRHMMGTLDALLDHHGPDAKAIVWAHNTHVGDARATDMASAGMVNLGQLGRERHGRDAVVLVGFGSHHGGVVAGRSWGAPLERMDVPPARPGSWESVVRDARDRDVLLLTHELGDASRARRGHRAIGVVYDPELEAYGNYVPTELPERYDAFLHLPATRALHPLGEAGGEEGPPDTYPWGV